MWMLAERRKLKKIGTKFRNGRRIIWKWYDYPTFD